MSSTVPRERQLASWRTITQSKTWPHSYVGMSTSWTRSWSFNKVFNWSISPLEESSKWKLKSPINARSLRAWLYSETSVGNSSKNILFDSLFCLLGGGRYKQITKTDVRVERQRMHGDGIRQSGLEHDCNAATPAADAWEQVEDVATGGHLCKARFPSSAGY